MMQTFDKEYIHNLTMMQDAARKIFVFKFMNDNLTN